VLAARPDALPQRSAAAPAWGPPPVPLDWDTRSGLRSDPRRRPKDARPRAALARQMGADGSQRLDEVWAATRPPSLCTLPALEALRQMWVQPYDRGSLPGMAEGRWRSTEEPPPAAVRRTSPSALAARSCTTRDTPWVGDQLPLTETGEPEPPELRPQVLTPPAPTPAWTMGPPIVQAVAARDLLPGTPRCDSGSVAADCLVTAPPPQSDVVGPPLGSYRWQPQLAHGDDWQAFVVAGEAHQAHCPQGHTRVQWPPGPEVAGDPVFRSRFDRATCRACPPRHVCTAATEAPRQRTVRPHAHHEAIQAARQRQETPAFKAQ
jgi:Transposase DDE domain